MTVLILIMLAKVTIVLVLALIATWCARSARASVRHVMLAAAFAALLAMPMASAFAPDIRVAVPAAARTSLASPIVDALVQSTAERVWSNHADITEGTPPVPARSPFLSLAQAIAAIWILGAAICLIPVFSGMRHVRALRRTALPWPDRRGIPAILGDQSSMRSHVDLLLDESLPGPITCGLTRAAIILPADAPAWPQPDLHRAILHELEHVRRGDWFTHCLARIVASIYWFHPFVWVALRRMSLEAERACDDAVLRASAATDYADQLVTLAQRLSLPHNTPHLAMANRSDLATRVGAVLDGTQSRGRAGVTWVSSAVAVTAVLLFALSPLRIVASGQAAVPQTPTGPKARYDVATIRQCEAEENPTGARGFAGGTNATISPGHFYVPCVTTEQLIYLAYAAYGARTDEHLQNDDMGTASNAVKVRGGPSWVHSLRDKYRIEATAEGATERTVLMGTMLQSLLEDRFHLKLHRDTEEVPLLTLSVAKGGVKLKPMKDGDCDPNGDQPPSPNDVKPRCGNLMMTGTVEETRWQFNGFAPDALASQLSRTVGTHIVDKTGITDKSIFLFTFNRPEAAAGDTGSLNASLQDQLGLTLEKTKGPRGFLVIDAIERPTPDAPFMVVPSRASGSGTRR